MEKDASLASDEDISEETMLKRHNEALDVLKAKWEEEIQKRKRLKQEARERRELARQQSASNNRSRARSPRPKVSSSDVSGEKSKITSIPTVDFPSNPEALISPEAGMDESEDSKNSAISARTRKRTRAVEQPEKRSSARIATRSKSSPRAGTRTRAQRTSLRSAAVASESKLTPRRSSRPKKPSKQRRRTQ